MGSGPYKEAKDSDKVRVNAVILGALQSGNPAGVVDAFMQILNNTSRETVVSGKSMLLTPESIKIRSEAFQTALNDLRDNLITSDLLPELPAGSKGTKNELLAQQTALQAVRESMASSSAPKLDGRLLKVFQDAIKGVVKANNAVVLDNTVALADESMKPINQKLANFVALHSGLADGRKLAVASADASTACDPQIASYLAAHTHKPNKACIPSK